MTNKIYELTDEQFVNIIKESVNISEVLFKLGYTTAGNSWGFSQIKKRMIDLRLDHSIFKGKSAYRVTQKQKEITSDKLLCINCNHNRNVLRRYILINNLLSYQCSQCGITTWQNKTLSLDLDHINGINNDNRIENLRFLCPNCHSQTTTYGSKNRQRNESSYEITEELRVLVESTYGTCKSVKNTSSILGVRRSVVTKIVNESGQKHSNQRYVIRYDKDRNELKRYGSLIEAAKDLIKNKEVKTEKIKTCTRTITYNKDNFWLNGYWTVLDGSGIINNPLLESTLIDSENRNVDEAQAKAA